MLNYLLMCKSLTYAQRTSRALERSGITSAITKSASGIGCGYCVKITEKKLAASLTALNSAGLGPTRIFLQTADGSVSEVER